jgi:hypothetical protein
MENYICVYLHKKPNNEVFYVGIGNKKRPYSTNKRNKFWNNIVNKTPNYLIEIICTDISWDEACEVEKNLIKLYGRKCDGGTLCNITLGGDGSYGLIHSDKTKENLKKKSTGNKNCVGFKHSENTKFNMSQSHIGKKIPLEVREKMSKTHLGRPGRESDRENVKRAHLKVKGRVQSSNEKLKRAKKLYKPIEVDGVVYESIKKCIEITNMSRSKIWKYLNDDNNKNYKYINKK